MSNKQSVFIPFKSDGGERDRIADFTKQLFWEANGFKVVYGKNNDQQFNRSKAINEAVKSTDDEILIIADSDTIPSLESLNKAIKLAKKTGRMVMPFDKVYELNRNTSKWHLDNGVVPRNIVKAQTEKIRTEWSTIQSSVLVVPRKLFMRSGGFDERFVGWGREDNAFFKAMDVYGNKVERLEGIALHIWHSKPSMHVKVSKNNQSLWERYRAATSPEEIDAITQKVQTLSTGYEGADFTIFLQDHRRDEFIHRAIASIKKHVKSNYELVLVDDSKDPQWRDAFKYNYPDIEVYAVPSPGGYTKSMQTMVNGARHRTHIKSRWPVFWQADLIATDDIDLNVYLNQLLSNDSLSQVALLRPLVYENEIEAGDLIKAQHDRILNFRGYAAGGKYKDIYVHDYGWTDLISVINPDALKIPFPDGMNGEYNYGMLHLDRGFYSSWYLEKPRYIHVGNHVHEAY